MTIKCLKAGSGDSILIQNGTHNILIDGGNDFTYIRDEITQIYNAGQKLNLVVVTHHDDDHISGIIKLIEAAIQGDFGEGFIEEILVNTPRKINGTINIDDPSFLSYKQAFDLENLLLTYKISWTIGTDETQDKWFGDIKLRFLSPLTTDLGKYSSAKDAYLTSDYRCDWNSSMAALDPFISDKSQDSSDTNKTSVVILAESQNKKVLLTGDCTPKRMEDILDKLISEDPGKPLKLDYFKLPHHGSYRSLSASILSKIDCSKFIISANGNKNFLPNKRAILKVIKFISPQSQETEFIFNYAEPIEKLKITTLEKKKYRFNLIPNNQIYGHSI